MSYFIEAGSHQCSSQEKALHRTSFYFGLYVAQDGFNEHLAGKIAYVNVVFGENAYMQDQLKIQSYYVNGYNTLVITKLRVWDAHKEQRILLDSSSREPSIKHYFSQADFPIDSISEYSHGYWCRYLTTIPTRIITRPSSTPISRFSGSTRILGINII